MLLGSDADAQKLGVTLERVNTLLARLDGIAVKADAQVLGPNGVVPESRATIVQLNAMLGDARATLKKVDGVLAEAQAVAANARVATTDLNALRSEVDTTVRKVEQLVDVGALDPEQVHTPGVYVDRIVQGPSYQKRIEFRNTRPRPAA